MIILLPKVAAVELFFPFFLVSGHLWPTYIPSSFCFSECGYDGCGALWTDHSISEQTVDARASQVCAQCSGCSCWDQVRWGSVLHV